MIIAGLQSLNQRISRKLRYFRSFTSTVMKYADDIIHVIIV